MKKSFSVKLFVLSLLVVTMIFTITGCGGNQTGNSQDTKMIEIKLASPFPTTAESEWAGVNYFVEEVNKELAGKAKVTVLGGPEVIPAQEQAEALRTGALDMMFGTAGYWVQVFPEADAIKLIEYSPMESRENGIYDYYSDLFQQKGNAKYIGMAIAGPVEWFYFYLSKPVDKPDFSGMMMRTIPIYEPVQKALGAQVTTMPATDINNAMDRGIINGFCYPIFSAQNYTYYESAKYIVDHGFFYGEAPLVMNLDKWNELPEDVQKVLSQKGIEMEEYFWEFTSESLVKDKQYLIDHGVEFIKFSPEDEKKFNEITKEAGWAKIKERCPESYETLRDMLTK